jgi:hypothetical protein
MLSRQWGFRWVIILTGVGAALSWLAQIIFNEELGFWWRLGIAGVGMFCAGQAVILPLIQQRSYEQTLFSVKNATYAGRLAAYTEFQDYLIPAINVLAEIACATSSARRQQHKSNLKRAIVGIAARRIGPDRTRACYFDYDIGPPPALKCHGNWDGRSTEPSEYTTATTLGRVALAMVSQRQFSFRPDLDKEAPRGWPKNRDYKTYVSVTVATESQIFGMLTLDSLKAGSLVSSDVLQMKLLGSLLAVGLAMGGDGA